MNEPHYHINLFWSAEDECWIADVPDLKPCSAHGDTLLLLRFAPSLGVHLRLPQSLCALCVRVVCARVSM